MKCLCSSTRRAARVLTRHYEEHLRPCGLTPSQFEIMGHLQGRPGVSQVGLAQVLGADQTTLSRSLRLLVVRGWVKKVACASDRRQAGYELTPSGLDGLREAQPYWSKAQADMQERLGGEWEAAFRLVDRLAAAAAHTS